MHFLTPRRFFITLICLLAGISAYAADEDRTIPDDRQTIVGRLENGLTYYIRHNSNPKGCADFYIVHDVGALQEDDNQNGLAHFLEHMAFNGTKHYPEKTLLEFLSKEGVRFGYNVNAYTSRHETVYNLSDIPLVRESFVDSVMMVLHDWSCDILCEQEALDAERGVISEEWRRRDEQRARMAAAQTALIYKGAKHTERSVLGTLEIINGFRREEILDFYHKWYRPDLQAVVIAGDFDVQDMEKRVKRIFSDIPATENPAQKEVYPIPALSEPLFENMIDPDVKFQTLKVIHKMPYPKERARESFWKQHYTKQIVTSMIEKRLKVAARRPGSPVNSAVIVTNPSSADFYISLFTLTARTDKLLEETLAFYSREVKQILDHGFSRDEFNSGKQHVARRNKLDKDMYAEDVTNEQIVNICKEHFLRSKALADPVALHEIQKAVLSEITFEDAASCLKEMLGDSEKIYSYTIGESRKHLLPSEERMKEIINAVSQEKTEPAYISFKKIDLSDDAVPGRILKTRKCKDTDGEIWHLGNGATVYWMPSEPVKSSTHMAMKAIFSTGYNAWPQDRIGASKAAAAYITRETGFGTSTSNDIGNSPECGSIRAVIDFDKLNSSITVLSGKEDAGTAFRMLHDYLTRPYFNTEKELGDFCEKQLRSLEKEPGSAILFSREQTASKYGSHPWTARVDSAAMKTVDMAFVKEIYSRTFGNPNEMTLFISSDLDRETVYGLVEKYIASVSASGNWEKASTEPMNPVFQGEVVLERNYPQLSAPKVDVRYDFLASVRNTAANNTAYEVLDYIMSQRYVDRIREERGGTYHVHFASLRFEGNDLCESTVEFQTRPEMEELLLKDTQDLIDDLCKYGPSEDELENAVRYLIKAHGEREQKFANNLTRRLDERVAFIMNGTPFDFDYVKVISKLTIKDIQKLTQKVNNGRRHISVYREADNND